MNEAALHAAVMAAPYRKGLRAMLEPCAESAPAGIACEFGVSHGETLRRICAVRKSQVFGFDSFKGLPDDWVRGPTAILEEGAFSCAPPQVPCELVIGLFEQTIPAWKREHGGSVQFLHIDCDLYRSTRGVLFGLNERIVPGAHIVFDELVDTNGRYENWREGEWRALMEWLHECGRLVRPIGRADFEQVAFVVET